MEIINSAPLTADLLMQVDIIIASARSDSSMAILLLIFLKLLRIPNEYGHISSITNDDAFNSSRRVICCTNQTCDNAHTAMKRGKLISNFQ